MYPRLLMLLTAMRVSCEPTQPPDCLISSQHNRKTADCRGHSLVESPSHLDTEVKVLLLGSNQLSHIIADNFIQYPALQELELNFNRISAIAPDAFRGLSNLRRLDLSRNRLATVPTTAWTHLPNIRDLSLKGNPITYVTRGAFLSLTHLQRLELGGCRISHIDSKAFISLSKLTDLDLAGNDLMSLPVGTLPQSLSVLRLYGNPWHCDCRLRWLRMWVVGRTTKRRHLNWQFGPNTPKCESPSALRAQTWHDLTARKFGCAPTIDTPGGNSDGGKIVLGYGTNVTLACSASGDPRPHTWWVAAAGGIIKNEERDKTRILTLLILKNITKSADYTCFAENSAGRDSLTFAIRLRPPALQINHRKPTLNPIYVAIATVAVGTTIIAIAFTVICCAARSCVQEHGKYAVHESDKEADMLKPLPSGGGDLLEISETDSASGGDFTMRIFSHTPICADDEPYIEVVDGTSLNTPDLLLDDRHSPYMQHRRAENAYTRTEDLKPAIRLVSEDSIVCNSTSDLKPAIRSDTSDTESERAPHVTRTRKPVTFSDDVQIQEIPLLDNRHRCASPCRNPICHHRRPLSRSHSANTEPPSNVSSPVIRQSSVDSISPVHINTLNKSPPRKPARTYQSSSLDDILAPPFQTSPMPASKHSTLNDTGTSV